MAYMNQEPESNKISKMPQGKIQCIKNDKDCMFGDGTGKCIAEWCIWDKLPKVSGRKTVTCSVCKKNVLDTSPYSNIQYWICPTCIKRIDELVNKNKCVLCGTTLQFGMNLCSACADKINKMKNPKCPICGKPIEVGQSICSECATSIKEKINKR